jgi:threonine/homoserine/homoserine lactone efflux protein
LVPAASLWAFALAAFALIVIPGPSVLFVIPGPSVLFVIARIYLGVQAVRHCNDHTESSPAAKMRPSSLRLLREGFIVGATNPKTMVFFVAVLPSSSTTHTEPSPCRWLPSEWSSSRSPSPA